MDSMLQAGQFGAAGRGDVSTDEEIDALIAANAAVCVGVSGGKDSQAVALAVARHLDAVGHHGPRVLVHADLGRVEWKDSLAVCQRLADHLGWELIVVRRPAGDMLDRWESRWVSRSQAYIALETVKLTLPWATPNMRFCTSEMKVDVISRALRKRFPTGPILSVDGVRAQESHARSKKTISSPATKLTRKANVGVNWHAILPWSVEEVFAEIDASGMAPHVAYRVHGSSRVSCSMCIMGSLPDLTIATNLDEHLDTYRWLVDLECRSTFAFQGSRWLGDIAPSRLTNGLRERLERSKAAASVRRAAEAEIPAELLFDSKGWPSFVPDIEQARLLASVRHRVGEAVGLPVQYTDASAIRARYSELLDLRLAKVA
ncbi:MAG: phosphoadenosine phosphosulfate reductase family protein [Rhodanobacter sp.]|jgi:3'-phosphoadenosine 5'-phosphosulfate sulfotransferase (PAPS reductase)/FAD synthetase